MNAVTLGLLPSGKVVSFGTPVFPFACNDVFVGVYGALTQAGADTVGGTRKGSADHVYPANS